MTNKTLRQVATENEKVCKLIEAKLSACNNEIFNLKRQLNLDVYEICKAEKVNENQIRQIVGMKRSQTNRP